LKAQIEARKAAKLKEKEMLEQCKQCLRTYYPDWQYKSPPKKYYELLNAEFPNVFHSYHSFDGQFAIYETKYKQPWPNVALNEKVKARFDAEMAKIKESQEVTKQFKACLSAFDEGKAKHSLELRKRAYCAVNHVFPGVFSSYTEIGTTLANYRNKFGVDCPSVDLDVRVRDAFNDKVTEIIASSIKSKKRKKR
jgi:hypothetical protein